jgi:OOP family OmpA-OmpF porin
MSRLPLFLAALMTVLPSLSSSADKVACTDHALFPTRMPAYELVDCKTEEYGTYAYQTTSNAKAKTPVEGKFTVITYSYTGPRGGEPSALAMVRNYEAAIAKVGGSVVYSDPARWVTGKVVKDGKEAWFQAEKGNGKIWLRIVEKKAMTQYIVADAAAFGNDINATGHVAVYGIYFDTNKSEVKPDSRPALEEIAKLLAQSPGLKLLVVGHTDMTGSLDANMKLSQARADSVVQALVSQHGVAPARLKGHGVGPLAPVASNDTEEGRAKNRRVELVKE